MNEEGKTSALPRDELVELHRRVAELEGDLAEARKAQEVLCERERKFKRLVENISDVIFEVDHQGVVLYFSPIGLDIWGYDREDLIGRNFIELVHPDDRELLLHRFAELASGVEYPLFYRLRNKAGDFKWVRTRTKPRMEKGIFSGATGTLIDVTDQRRAEEALQVSEANVRAIMNASLGVIVLLDEHGIIIDNNAAHARRYSLTREEMIGRRIFDLMPLELAETRQQAMESVFRTGQTFKGQDMRAGIWNEFVIYPIYDDDGKVVRVAVYAQDITDRKVAEDKLKILNELVDIAPASITVHDFSGRFLYANQKTFDMHGYSREEFLAATLQEIDAPESKELIADRMKQIAETGEASFEVTHFRKDRSVFPLVVHVKLGNWGGQQVLFSIATDITEQRRKEAELDKIRKLLTETQAITKVGGWEYETSTGQITWTDEVYRIHGVGRDYDPNDIQRSISFYAPEDAAVIEKSFRRAVKTGEPYDLELRFIRANGERIWVRTIGKTSIEDGKVVRVTGNIMDITDRKAEEEALKESEEKFRTLFESIKDGIAESDLQGRIITCNQAYLDMTGHSPEEIRQLRYQDLTPGKWHHEDDKQIKKALARGYSDAYEKERIRKDGTTFPISIRIWSKTGKDGKPIGNWGIISDITERKQAEKKSQDLLNFLQTLINTIPSPIFCKNIDGIYEDCNKEFEDYVGKKKEEIVGKRAHDLFPKDLADKYLAKDLALFHQTGRQIYEAQIMYADGTVRDVVVNKATYQNNDGDLAGLVGVMVDITGSKQVEAALRNSEGKYRNLFDNAVEGIYQTTPTGRIASANMAYARMFGYESPEEVTNTVTNIALQLYANPGDRKRVLEQLKETGYLNNFECLMRRKDGSNFWVVMNARITFLTDGASCLEGFIFDITERKRAEEILKESEERLRIVSQSTTDAIWDWNIPKETLAWFGDIDRILGYFPGEFPRTIAAWEKIIHPHDRDRVMTALEQHLQKGIPYLEEYRVIRKNGDICYWIDRGMAMYDEKGTAYRMIGSCADITKRKEAEAALQESEERFRLLVENAPDGIFIQTRGQFAYVNRAALKMFGAVSPEQLCGQSIMTRFHPDYQAIIRERVRLLNEESKEASLMEQKYLKLDGTPFDVEVSAVPFFYESRQGALVFFRDITDRKQTEEALKESERSYRELSIIDALTQLYNSRHFYNQLKMEIDRVNRYEAPMTIILLDLDDFKHFNDTYGHVEGDHVLSRLGQVVKRCLRQTDSAYRYGGEEFTIILPMTTSKDAAVTAERIRSEFKNELFSPERGKDVHVTVSIGLAQYRRQEDVKAYVHRVDQLMYQAKKEGKDRVCSERP